MLEPAQLDIMHVKEVATIEFVCVSSHQGITIDEALQGDYLFLDWGLTFGLDHRRAFPDAPEAITRVSHAKMALEYINSIGGSAYLPRRMVEKDVEFKLLYDVLGAPTFERIAYATYPVRSPRLELIEQSLKLIPVK